MPDLPTTGFLADEGRPSMQTNRQTFVAAWVRRAGASLRATADISMSYERVLSMYRGLTQMDNLGSQHVHRSSEFLSCGNSWSHIFNAGA
jgi:hypothetical protein